MQTVGNFFNRISAFSQEHPKIFNFLTKTASLLMGVAAALAAVKAAIFVFKAMTAWGGGSIKMLQSLWNVAKMHPFVAIGAAIAGAATLIITNWEKVKSFFASLWEWLTEKFQTLFGWIGKIGDFFGNIGSKVGGFFKNLWPFGKKEEAATAASMPALPQLTPPPANTNRNQTNNVTINVSGASDPKAVGNSVADSLSSLWSDNALYDRALSGGFYTGG